MNAIVRVLSIAMLTLTVPAISASPTKSCVHGIVNVIQTRTGATQIIKYPEYFGRDVYLFFKCTENGTELRKLIPAGTLMIEVSEEEVSDCFYLIVWASPSESETFRLD